MSIPDLVETVRSGVVHIEFRVNGTRVASGSGFFSRGMLVTNHHVFLGPQSSTVALTVQPTVNPQSAVTVEISYSQFANSLVSGSDERNYDFAALRIPSLKPEDWYQFELSSHSSKRVGDPVIVLGFPLDHSNLVCHLGTISSFYESGPAQVIQLDASVNHSNSGGPLVDPTSCRVVGIVTRKATGLSTLFDQLVAVLDQNVTVLNGYKGYMNISGFDPAVPMIAAQHQIKALAHEIQRSANVGIGYAFSAEHILSDVVFAS